MKVLSARVHKGFVIARLEGIDDMNAAMALKGTDISIAREDAHLSDGAYFLSDIIGSRVVDEEGREIGTLEEIEETPSAPLYTVHGEREHLIPAVPEFIRSLSAVQQNSAFQGKTLLSGFYPEERILVAVPVQSWVKMRLSVTRWS